MLKFYLNDNIIFPFIRISAEVYVLVYVYSIPFKVHYK